jgi:hypothetical protein
MLPRWQQADDFSIGATLTKEVRMEPPPNSAAMTFAALR